MAVLAGTMTTFDARGIREDLSDAIYNISPKDTPFMSNIKKGQATQTFFEWQQDTLATPDGSNAHLDGDDVSTFDSSSPTERVGNYTQISRKTVIISGTLEAVDKAGRKSELAYQLAKRSAELKRDLETIMLQNQGARAGNSATARLTGSLSAWIKTVSSSQANSYSAIVAGSDTNAPVYTNIPVATRTDGTQTAFTEQMVKDGMLGSYNQGGKPEMLMVGAHNKVVFSGFSGIATKTFYQSAVSETAIIGAADVYVSDFGILAVVPNRFQRARDAFLIDPEFAAMIFLRPFLTEPLAKTGDAEKRMLIVEWGLKVHNEKAHAGLYDLTVS
jgi:hypothetical protein